ncbi:MAG: uncharacterized protein A8A55_1955 [Amphiamblys sp. WSBS2006]|nr:MAG: uncharacterized protein A8A55_1955 [Amphiamblys sp. WSBS2006]
MGAKKTVMLIAGGLGLSLIIGIFVAIALDDVGKTDESEVKRFSDIMTLRKGRMNSILRSNEVPAFLSVGIKKDMAPYKDDFDADKAVGTQKDVVFSQKEKTAVLVEAKKFVLAYMAVQLEGVLTEKVVYDLFTNIEKKDDGKIKKGFGLEINRLKKMFAQEYLELGNMIELLQKNKDKAGRLEAAELVEFEKRKAWILAEYDAKDSKSTGAHTGEFEKCPSGSFDYRELSETFLK